MAGMSGLVLYSPTLYQMFCDLTGFGGTVQRATDQTQKSLDAKPANEETITVHFNAEVFPGLPWEFRPEQRKVTTKFGEPTKVYYYAENNSDETIVARATFNVTPYKAARYFFKIECFCFTNEKLAPGESARMPLVLYVDEQLMKDDNTEEVRDLTLSYTFFRQDDLTEKQLQATRDLKAGSERIENRLNQENSAEFVNDAPRD
jgi:cytochrome c oxidase assembly protein subunit 11